MFYFHPSSACVPGKKCLLGPPQPAVELASALCAGKARAFLWQEEKLRGCCSGAHGVGQTAGEVGGSVDRNSRVGGAQQVQCDGGGGGKQHQGDCPAEAYQRKEACSQPQLPGPS